ncbi:MAG: hypothetical protein MSG64_15635 [Pyrinomonadaceae bacterium MAG19_C2-C3]|nr:hypothetical protein [Pyrinomonadaceae bacterium MAG19_C2-C3]
MEARTLLGAPYAHQGRSMVGIDCIGVVIVVAHRLEYTDFDYTLYAREPEGEVLLRLMREFLDEIEVGDLQEGDVPLIRFPRRQEAQHTGIVAQGVYELNLIHAYAGKNFQRVIEQPLRAWDKHITHAFRFRGVVNG